MFFAFEEAPTGLGEVAGIVVAMVILLIAFGSFVAMGLPIGMALFGLVVGVTAMKLVTYLVEIPMWAPQLAAMVGLGVGIDYALFLVTRHREHLALGMPVDEAVGKSHGDGRTGGALRRRHGRRGDPRARSSRGSRS